MRRKPILTLYIISLALMLVSPVVIQACERTWFPRQHMDPIVSPTWLKTHLGDPNLVILDVRTEGYDDGHILGAIHSPPFPNWVTGIPFVDDPPWLEVPDKKDLYDTLGAHGITKDSWVVIVGTTSGPIPLGLYNSADITRVAMTLIYAGVKNVAILDGGMEAWVRDIGEITKVDPTVDPGITPVKYNGKVKKGMFVSTKYVKRRLRRSILVDARDANIYTGPETEPWALNSPGHIPGARNLPTPTLWDVNYDGDNVASATYWDIDILREMARDVVGKRKCSREIIVYCGVGGYASTVFFVLSEVLGYSNVKVYDGSMQMWDYYGLPTIES